MSRNFKHEPASEISLLTGEQTSLHLTGNGKIEGISQNLNIKHVQSIFNSLQWIKQNISTKKMKYLKKNFL